MRPFTYNIYPLWLCLLLLLSACMQEDLQSVPNEGEGVLKLGLSARAELSSVLTKATIDCPVAENEIPTQEDFIIKVMDSQGIVQYEGSFKASIVLPIGIYTVEAYYNGTGLETLPATTKSVPNYFKGSATNVEIKSNNESTATIEAKWGYSIIAPIIADETLLNHLTSWQVDVKVDGITSTLTREGSLISPLYVLAGENVEVYFNGINDENTEVSTVLATYSSIEAAKKYNISCSLISISLPEQAATNAWSKFIYVTPMTTDNINASDSQKEDILQNITYEAVDGSGIVYPAEYLNGKYVIRNGSTGLTPSTLYTIRARYHQIYAPETYTLTTENAQVLAEGSLENWSKTELNGGNDSWSRPAYCHYVAGWSTRNERTTKGVEEATAWGSGVGYSVYWRWCSGTISTTDKTTGSYAAEISTLAFYNEKVSGAWKRESVYNYTKENGTAYAGYLFTGTFNKDNDSYTLGISHAARPVSISFDFKYLPRPTTDQCFFYVKVWDESGNEIAEIEPIYGGTTNDSYVSFQWPLTYVTMGYIKRASKIGIFFQSGTNLDISQMKQVEGDYTASPWGEDRVVGSVLKVDNVVLHYDYIE